MGKRDLEFRELFDRANDAGLKAGEAIVPVPMVVIERANPLDDRSPAVKRWPVEGGVCGFAWITVRPGTSAFARWLAKTKLGHTAYGGGVSVWVGAFGQSMTRKEAYARAFADVLKAAGITAYAESRID